MMPSINPSSSNPHTPQSSPSPESNLLENIIKKPTNLKTLEIIDLSNEKDWYEKIQKIQRECIVKLPCPDEEYPKRPYFYYFTITKLNQAEKQPNQSEFQLIYIGEKYPNDKIDFIDKN